MNEAVDRYCAKCEQPVRVGEPVMEAWQGDRRMETFCWECVERWLARQGLVPRLLDG